MTAAVAPTSAAPVPNPGPAAPPLAGKEIGRVDVRRHRDTPMFAGPQTSPNEGYSGLEDALSAAARQSINSYAGQVLVRTGKGEGARYHSFELHQPAWDRGFLRDNAYSTRPTTFVVDGHDKRAGEPQVWMTSNSEATDDPHGVFRTLPKRGIVGIVDGTTAVLGRDVRSVQPTPPPPWKPTETFVQGLRGASTSLDRAEKVLLSIPPERQKDAAYDPVRKQVHTANRAAQDQIEGQFLIPGTPADVVGELQEVDKRLEDANWQIVTRLDPSGRYNGVDVKGSLASMREGHDLLRTAIDKYAAQVEQPQQ